MKKSIALLLFLALTISLIAGCGTGGSETTAASQTETTVATTAETTAATTAETTVAETTTAETTTAETTTEATTIEETTVPVTPPEDNAGLVVHLDFEKITGTTIADVSGNGHDGVVSGTPTLVDGHDGKSLSLTGAGQHVVVKDSADLNFTKDSSFTLDVWFRWNGTFSGGNWPCVVQKGLLISAKAYQYVGFWVNNGTRALNLGLSAATGAGIRNLPAGTPLNTTWHHAVAIQNAEKNTMNFYLDDVLQQTTAAIDMSAAGYDMTIGFNGIDGQFIGDIDELKVYNCAKDESNLNNNLPGVDGMKSGEFAYTDSALNQSVTLPYRVYYPSNYDVNSKQQYPILLFLHGYGECGTDNKKQIRVLDAPNGLLDKLIEEDNCIILAPQCVSEAQYNWVPLNHVWSTGSRELTENATVSLSAATALLKSFIGTGKVNEKRVYVAGLSMGGYGTWEIIARNPDLFAAAIPVCGAGIPSKAASLIDMPIWAFHGSSDPTVPVSGTKDMEAAIKAAGGTKMKATYYAGVAHNSWIPAFNEAGLVDWLLSQSK